MANDASSCPTGTAIISRPSNGCFIPAKAWLFVALGIGKDHLVHALIHELDK